MTSFSVYPNDIDGYSTLPLRKDGVHEIRADDYNRLRDAIVKIEQELGIQPSAVFATIRARMDSIGDASASIESHLVNPTDAHDASAISIIDVGDNYVSGEVEGALSELASFLPAGIDVIGEDKSSVPNDGIPNFVGGSGTLHVFNTSTAGTEVKKTQPISITGVHIVEIGTSNGNGVGELKLSNHSPATAHWKAPGDSFGVGIDISSLSAGDVVTIESSTTSKKIRIARNSSSFPASSPLTETFDLSKFDAVSGTYSISGTGFKDTNNITRTSTSITGLSNNQLMIGGMVSPADKGTLVLQRKLRLAAAEFVPIAILDLSANFSESKRSTGQSVYIPALTNFDTITLFDRLPARQDYETLSLDADGNSVYDNFDIQAPFISFQVGKYLIPISNSNIVTGELEAPTDTSLGEIESKISAYRLVHYIAGVTDFTGEPASSNIFSISDVLAGSNDGDNNVRISNVYADPVSSRPSIEQVILRPVLDAEVTPRIVSGVHYYNSSSDLFDVEVKSDTNIFTNTYLQNDILRFTTDVFSFPGEGDGYGKNVELSRLFDDGYSAFTSSNLPVFTDRSFYLINGTNFTDKRLSPVSSQFSNNAHIAATMHDPFGAGVAFDAYGVLTPAGTDVRLLVNSFSSTRSTDTTEWFTDEDKRVGELESFDFALDAGQFTGAGGSGTLDTFDNTAPLVTGSLQCGGSFVQFDQAGLIYPQFDFDLSTANIRPLQQSGTDYSGFSGDATYQRLFNLGFTSNGGRLRIKSIGDSLVSFSDIDVTNSSRPIKIEVKIPGISANSTGFMEISELFETGRFDDGYGALIGPVTGISGDFTVPFTFGTRNNADTANMIAVRITYFGSPSPVLADAKTKIISLVQILGP